MINKSEKFERMLPTENEDSPEKSAQSTEQKEKELESELSSDSIRGARLLIKEKLGVFRNVLARDRERINSAIMVGAEASRKVAEKEEHKKLYQELARMDSEAFNLEKLTEEQIEQLEGLRRLDSTSINLESVDEFLSFPKIKKRYLLAHGFEFSKRQINKWIEKGDLATAIDWAKRVDRHSSNELKYCFATWDQQISNPDLYIDYLVNFGGNESIRAFNKALNWLDISNRELDENGREKTVARKKRLFEGSLRKFVDNEGVERVRYDGDLRLYEEYLSFPKDMQDQKILSLVKAALSKDYPDLISEFHLKDSISRAILDEFYKDAYRRGNFQAIEDEDALISRLQRILESENGAEQLSYLFKEHGLVNLHRYSDRLLRYQYEHKDDPNSKGLMITGLSDHNGAFQANSKNWDSLLTQSEEQDINFVICEAGSAKQLFSQVKKWGKLSPGGLQYLIVGGHGTKTSLELGWGTKYSHIYSENITQNALAGRLKEFLGDEAPIALVSCSTGAQSEGGREYFAQKYSGILETEITGPERPTAVSDITFKRENGKLRIDVKYNGDAQTYVSGKPRGIGSVDKEV